MQLGWQRRTWAAMVMAALLLLGNGCATEKYRKSADRDAYAAIREKSWQVENMDPGFSIEGTNEVGLAGFPRVTVVEEFLGPEGVKDQGAAVVTLEKSLEIAVRQSRTYQNNKEQLFLAALGLTLARQEFTPLFKASGNARVSSGSSVQQASQIVTNLLTGIVQTNAWDQSVVRDPNFQGGTRVNVDWLIRDLGRIGAALTVDFSRLFSHGVSSLASSQLVGTFSRPLLRNAGFKREQEALVQSERNLLYAVREFTRFRKTFSVETASAYYGVLRNRDQARNAHLNLLSFKRAAERTRAMAIEGRAKQSELGRLEQQELSAESGWISAVRSYLRSLDDFKIRIGLPVGARVVLDDRELTELIIRHPDVSVDDAIRVALVARLDYLNERDRLDDAVRGVDLAAEDLKVRVDLTAGGSLSSDPSRSRLDAGKRYEWNAGLDLDVPLSNKAERNAYRGALIRREQAGRSLAQARDEIELGVRDSWRSLEEAKRAYEISEVGLKLAERRVEEQNLLAELGRSQALDLVDAQNDLATSRNARTQALIGHTLARLQFWNNMGILYIKDNGQWEEGSHASNN